MGKRNVPAPGLEAPRAIAAAGSWLPRISLAAGIGATIAMNVTGGLRDGAAGGALVAALPPVALVLSLETLIWMIRRNGAWDPVREWEQWAAAVTLAGLAGITGTISYLHALTVAQWTGSHDVTMYLIPLVADLMIVTGSLALMARARTETAAAASPGDPGKPRGDTPPPRRAARDPGLAAALNDAEREMGAELARTEQPWPSARQLALDPRLTGSDSTRRRAASRAIKLALASSNGGSHDDGD